MLSAKERERKVKLPGEKDAKMRTRAKEREQEGQRAPATHDWGQPRGWVPDDDDGAAGSTAPLRADACSGGGGGGGGCGSVGALA
jgi:hypothetical protein